MSKSLNPKINRFKEDIFAQAGFFILLLFFGLSLIQSFLPSPFEQDLKKRLLHPGISGHLLGTDQFGRDLLSRLVFGIRISIYAGIFGSLISIIIGIYINIM